MSDAIGGKHFTMTSGKVAVLTVIVWLSSLIFTTFVPYGRSSWTWSGLAALMLGWLAILHVSIAWLANPCLLIALARRRSGGVGFALAAALLSLDSFRPESLPTGDGSQTVYGYGPGFVLWLAAMGVGMIATGMRVRELRNDAGSGGAGKWARELGIAWLLLLVVGFGTLAIKDRQQANVAEKERLRSVVIKRGPVCSREPPVGSLATPEPAHILEFSAEAGYPFDSPQRLVYWGIPVVRAKGHDYALIGSGRDRMIRITPAEGPPSAILRYIVEGKDDKGRSDIRIWIGMPAGKTAFDYRWTRDGPEYCPEYKLTAGPNEQPRKVVMEVLGLASLPVPKALPNFWDSVHRTTGTVVGREPAGQLPWQHTNIGCPPDTGFSYERASRSGIYGTPFFVGRTGYQFANTGHLCVCSGDAVYIYSSTRNSGDYFLTITRRSLRDLERAWSVNIKVANADAALQERETRVVSVAEAGDKLRIRTRHYGHDQILAIEAPLPQSREPPPKQ